VRGAVSGTGRWLTRPLAVGALLRTLVALLPVQPAWDGVLYLRAAEQLAAGEGYTLRMLRLDAEPLPTAFYPVGYPALLSLLVGVGLSGAALRVAQGLLASLSVLGAGLLGRRLAGLRAGRAAAWIMALHPGSILLAAGYLAEPVFAAALALLLAFAVHRRRRRDLTPLALPLGALALVRPVSAVLAVLLPSLDALLRGGARKALGAAFGAALLVGLALAPWTLHNEFALGSPVPIATNGGFNLLLGTVGAGNFAALPVGVDCRRDDIEVGPAAHFEAAKDRCRSRRAVARIAADPLGALGRAALKLGDTFGHESSPARHLAAALDHPEDGPIAIAGSVLCTLAIFAIYGLAWRGRSRHLSARTRLALLVPLVSTALLHGLVLGGDRYHLAVVPCLAALAGAGWPSRDPRRIARAVTPVP
jgi:hypothetical protein